MTMKCKKCEGDMILSKDEKTLICPYCGNTELIEESDAVKTEKIRQNTYKEVESEKRRLESERLRHEIERDKANDSKDQLREFKKGKLSKALPIFAVISLLMAFVELYDGFYLAGIIAVVQAILYITAWLIGMQVFRLRQQKIYILITIISLVLIIPFFMTLDSSSKRSYKNYEDFRWSDITLGEKLPESPTLYGDISFNSDDRLSLSLPKITKQQYRDYVNACADFGYIVEADKSDTLYSAFNPDGYELRLRYSESAEEIDISLDAPEEMSEFVWPTSGIASLLPAPPSSIGHIVTDTSGSFSIHVGNVIKSAMVDYSKLCEDAGFGVDYSRSDTMYSAKNASGYKLYISYLGFDTIEISIYEPKIEESETTAKPLETSAPVKNETTTAENSSDMVDGMRKEFKDAMDSYEKFFDEYAAFMKKYSESGNSLTMLADYTKFLAQYADTMKKMNELGSSDLNEKETLYYAEVSFRIAQKLGNAVE